MYSDRGVCRDKAAVRFWVTIIILMFGLFVSGTMFLVMRWNAANHRADPHLDRLIGEVKH